MADEPDQSKWGWKVNNDRSRRDELRRQQLPNTDSGVVYRQKKPDRRRKERMKKRWSVRPDVSLVVVPPGKQCHVIGAVILIFLGVFLALSGLVVLFILTDLKTLGLGVGISVLLLGVIILAIGLVFLLYVCCFRTSTRYKQYIAQYKSGEQIELKAAATPLREDPNQSVMSKTTAQTQLDSSSVARIDGGSITESAVTPLREDPDQSVMSKTTLQTQLDSRSVARTDNGGSITGSVSQQSDTNWGTNYVTANEQTPSTRDPRESSSEDATKTQWTTPSSFQRLNVKNITEFSLDMNRAGNGSYGENMDLYNRYQDDTGGDIPEITVNSPGPEPVGGGLENLEEVLREFAKYKSDDDEMIQLMNQRGPVDTSTPVHPHGHQFDHGSRPIPVIVEPAEKQPMSTPPAHIPPSYDQVIRNYRTYSRSTSPNQLMETNL